MGGDGTFPAMHTADEPMCTLTYLAFWALIVGIWIGTGALVWWIRREICRMDSNTDDLRAAIKGHDDYITTANEVIGNIHINMAVQENSVKDLKADISEIKTDIKTLLKR